MCHSRERVLDLVTRPLPVSPVSLQTGGPRHGDQATSCPESSKLAWVADWTVPRDGLAEASTGPILAMLCRRPCVSGGPPRTLWEPGSQCWPHHLRIPQHLLPGRSNGRARAQTESRDFRPSRGAAAGPSWGLSSQLCPLTWVAGALSMPSIPQLSGQLRAWG